VHSSLTTAHGRLGRHFAVKAPDIYTSEEVHFLSAVDEQIALAFDNALHFDAAQCLTAAVGEEERAPWTSTGIDQSCGFNLEFRDLLPEP